MALQQREELAAAGLVAHPEHEQPQVAEVACSVDLRARGGPGVPLLGGGLSRLLGTLAVVALVLIALASLPWFTSEATTTETSTARSPVSRSRPTAASA